MAGDKKESVIPITDMAGLMEMISAMGDGEMLTIEIVTDGAAVPDNSGTLPEEGGANGK